MLIRLTIRDFVLVDRLELDFAQGFGALTGETGAGKSILVDALSFVLGERADAGLIRAGTERAEVIAEFDVSGLPEVSAWLADNDIDAADGLLLRRLVDRSGRSRAYLCGTQVTLQQLREVSDQLVDIHGQHAHQSLLRTDAQRAILDSFGGLDEQVGRTGEAWRTWREQLARWRAAEQGGEALAREREQLAWEVGELETLGFQPEEWQSLNDEQRRLAHASSLAEGAESSLQALADGDDACAARLAQVVHRLDQLSEFDERLQAMTELVRSAAVEVDEAAAALRRYADRIDLDPGRLAEVDQRIDSVLALSRKYRVSPEDLPGVLAVRREKLVGLEATADPQVLREAAERAGAEYRERSAALSAARAATADRLAGEVSARMQELALAGGRLLIALQPVEEGSAVGGERVEFQIAGVAGGEPRPLAKVASGGELSRISLALQVAASQAARVPTMVFDEVDVGIGGGVAEVVGRLLRDLGQRRQVLCVTHLPQVAARAHWQWRVSKRKAGEQFASQVETLDGQGRIEEIARMLGGVAITSLTREHAREMLGAG